MDYIKYLGTEVNELSDGEKTVLTILLNMNEGPYASYETLPYFSINAIKDALLDIDGDSILSDTGRELRESLKNRFLKG